MSMMCARWVIRSTTALAIRGSGNTLVHSPNVRFGSRSGSAFVAFGDDLEDELGGTVGQAEIAQLVEHHYLGAGVAADDPGELSAAVGFLEFVREAGEGGEPDSSSLLAGTAASAIARCVLPVPLE